MSNKTQRKFGLIAPFYGLFFKFQVKYYNQILSRTAGDTDLTQYKTALDIGCGTGALCQVLNAKGLMVTGVDAEAKMIQIARQKLHKQKITLLTADANMNLPFADQSFDVVITSYVAHGLPAAQREKLYAEMKRLARHRVILHDYNQNRAFLTSLVERLEGGDYFNFIKKVREELEEAFAEVRIIQVDTRAAWYICTP